MEKKEFARTVRMKESIRQYVEQQPGDTFADKFENMVRYSMEREKEIKKAVAQKEQQLKQLEDRINQLAQVERKLMMIHQAVDRAVENCKNI
ncbi:hypothetical protein U6B65_01435 [Oscillospiraceae bacterium MB08-C2-2]|nr:hypothetical protein U6B65_01435 [Oscillospiraceae bacterium MB08-C2-2]